MALSVDKAYILVLIPIVILAAVILTKKFVKTDRYVKTGTILRTLTIIALILSLSGISVYDKAADETTLFLADVSDSMSKQTDKIAEFIEEAQSEKSSGDKTAVTLFGGRSANIVSPTNEFVTVNTENNTLNGEKTDIEAALKHAANTFDSDTKKRIVLMTDGSQTDGDARKLKNMLRNENIQMLVYDMSGSIENETGIREISVPQYVNLNMNYDVSIIIDSTVSQNASLRLFRGSEIVLNKDIELHSGENRFVFTDKADRAGGITYHAELYPENDTFYQNNSVYGYCFAENLPSVLVAGDEENTENIRRIIEAAQLNADIVKPSALPTDYDSLIAYDSVILADVDYNELNENFVTALDSFVKYAGGGLITVGGENSFGPGQYSGTPLEDMLPVTMDIKNREETPDLSMIMVIDRSGSMSDNTGGVSRMDVAKEAAIRGIEQLEDDNYIGVIAFDSEPEWVVELQKVGENKEEIVKNTGSIQEGGGTSILPALRAACVRLSKTDTKLKHVILLTDGQAETKGYETLLNQAVKDKITISTIAVGDGADTNLLQYIAYYGNGRYYFANSANNLPEIFVYETMLASRDYINNESFYPSVADETEITKNIDSVPVIKGYVSTTPKGRADVVLQSETEEPVLAVWQYGLGRTAAWTSDLSGKWTDEWLASDEGVEIIRNLISWSMRSDILYDVEVTGEANDGVSEITAKIPVNENTTEVNAVIKAEDGREFESIMSASLPGEYVCTIPTDEEGAYIIYITETLSDGSTNNYNTGFTTGYSSEYDTRNLDNNGIIDELAVFDGVKVITSPDEVYSVDAPESTARKSISVPLVILALILLLIDILLRRFPEITDRIALRCVALKNKFKHRKRKQKSSDKQIRKQTEKIKNTKNVSEEKKQEEPVKKDKKQTDKNENSQNQSSSEKLADLKKNRKKK